MKISKIYTNKNAIFEPIIFNPDFNVIYAEVTKPKDRKKDSHNLGKTLLIDLIDFLMLKQISQDHFLKKNLDLFTDFEFYLEILLNSGSYLTIKRSVTTDTKISFKLHKEKNQNFVSLTKSEWDKHDISLKKAIELLDSYLNLEVIKPWKYRKGVSYFLRNQNDYKDVFQIEKYSKGKHKEWKPYLVKLLGFDDSIISKKYDLDDLIDDKVKFKDEYEKKLSFKSDEYDKLKGTIEIEKNEMHEVSDEIDRFNFYEQELKLNQKLVEDVESRISEYNNQLYNVDYEIEKIKKSLETKIKFNINEIKTIFEEVGIYFTNKLTKDYNDLLNFNKQLFAEREQYLKERFGQLNEEQIKIRLLLKGLSAEREGILSILRDSDSLDKFKKLQNQLVDKKTNLVKLESELKRLDSVGLIQSEIDELCEESKELSDSIKDIIREGNDTYSEIRSNFNKTIKHIFGVPALLSIGINSQGNLDFHAEFVKDEIDLRLTSEGEGTTYRKMLCAAFDLSMLKTYSNKSFYHFVYHDGILEGLDNRKKINFLELVHEYCADYNIQYILTVIDADLPRNFNDEKIIFNDNEIVKRLNDNGDEGRLFKIEKF